MAICRIQVTSPLIVLLEGAAWVSDPGEWVFGASSTGRRATLEAELGSVEVHVAEDTGVVVLNGEAHDVLTVEVGVQTLQTDQGPMQIAGLDLGIASCADQGRVRWVRRAFIGAPAGLALLEELQRRAPEPWTPESFTLALISALTVRHPADTFTYEAPLHVSYTRGEQQGRMDLTNFWESGGGEHARLEELLISQIGAYADLVEAPRADRQRVVAQVKHRDAVARVAELYGADGPVTEDLAGDAVLLYALDLPNGIMPLRESHRATLGIAREALRGVAASNLLALHDVVRVTGHPGETHLMVTCGGNYEASMLLVPEVWAAIDPVLQGDRVVAIPNRDLLLVADTAHPELIDHIRRFAGEMHRDGAYPVIDHLLVHRNGTWDRL